jgi:hypothetical protein
MKAKNRIGVFDLHVQTHELMGTRANTYIARWSTVSDNGNDLQTAGWEAASFTELKAVVDLLKTDLDVVLEKARQHFD